MVLQSTGIISDQDVATEFQLGRPNSMSQWYGLGGAPSTGKINFSDMYGRSSLPPTVSYYDFAKATSYSTSAPTTLVDIVGGKNMTFNTAPVYNTTSAIVSPTCNAVYTNATSVSLSQYCVEFVARSKGTGVLSAVSLGSASNTYVSVGWASGVLCTCINGLSYTNFYGLTDNTWFHVILTSGLCYINGVFQASPIQAVIFGSQIYTNWRQLGSTNSTFEIGFVKIYNTGFSGTQAAAACKSVNNTLYQLNPPCPLNINGLYPLMYLRADALDSKASSTVSIWGPFEQSNASLQPVWSAAGGYNSKSYVEFTTTQTMGMGLGKTLSIGNSSSVQLLFGCVYYITSLSVGGGEVLCSMNFSNGTTLFKAYRNGTTTDLIITVSTSVGKVLLSKTLSGMFIATTWLKFACTFLAQYGLPSQYFYITTDGVNITTSTATTNVTATDGPFTSDTSGIKLNNSASVRIHSMIMQNGDITANLNTNLLGTYNALVS